MPLSGRPIFVCTHPHYDGDNYIEISFINSPDNECKGMELKQDDV